MRARWGGRSRIETKALKIRQSRVGRWPGKRQQRLDQRKSQRALEYVACDTRSQALEWAGN